MKNPLPDKKELKALLNCRKEITAQVHDEYLEAIVTGNHEYASELQDDLNFLTVEIKELEDRLKPESWEQ